MREIVVSQVPGLEEAVATQLVAMVARLRELELKKAPSIAESVDWARTLIALEISDLDDDAVNATLGVVLKHVSDQERAVKELRLDRANRHGLIAGATGTGKTVPGPACSTATSPSSRRCARPACPSRWPRTSTPSRC